MGKSSKRLPPRERKKERASAPAMSAFLKYALVAGLAVGAAFTFQLFGGDPELRALKRSVAPLQFPKVTNLDYFQGGYKNEMLWGTYRPGMYLGIRARSVFLHSGSNGRKRRRGGAMWEASLTLHCPPCTAPLV